jgi:hypothetical protein
MEVMERYHILLAMPGPNIRFPTAQSCFTCVGRGHDLDVVGKDNASWDNMNALWVTALNATKDRGITHFAMIHADICPSLEQDWIKVLLVEMEAKGASFISAVVPIKDHRGLTSCGIADPDNPWAPIRRFTMKELVEMPETFDENDIGYSGYPLDHNSGLIMADLRDPVFFRTLPNSDELAIWFEFRKQCYVKDGVVKLRGESEDWNMSRRLWQQGVKTCITRKVKLKHFGMTGYPNDMAWGQYDHDWESRESWESNDLLQTAETIEEPESTALPPGTRGGVGVSGSHTATAPTLPLSTEKLPIMKEQTADVDV